MTIIEFIGFIIAFAAISISVARRMREERRRQQDPEAYERELRKQQKDAEEAYKELMRSLNIEVEEEPEPPPVPKRRPRQGVGTPAQQAKALTEVRAARSDARDRTTARSSQHGTHRRLSDDFELHSQIEDRKQVSRVEHRRIGTRVHSKIAEDYRGRLVSEELRGRGPAQSHIKGRKAKISTIAKEMPSVAHLLYAHEVIGTPKAYGTDSPLSPPWEHY